MTDARRPDQIEFIRLGGHTVRVTSWSHDEEAGAYRLVTIIRGSRDAELLDELLRQEVVDLELSGQEANVVRASDVDRREFGTGQSAITRFAVVLTPAVPTAEAPVESFNRALDDRVAALETEIAGLRAIVRRLISGQ